MTINGKTPHNLIDQFPGTIPDKLQPHDVEAESAVLGSILIDRDAIIRVAPILRPADFFIHRHGWIYEACLALQEHHTPVDLITLSDELNRQSRLEEIGGSAYLTSLTTDTPTSLHAEYYAKIVLEKAIRRRVIRAAGEMARLADNPELESGDLVAKSEKLLLDINPQQDNEPLFISQLLDPAFDQIDKAHASKGLTGLPTGLTDLDRLIGGLQSEDAVVIAGRPGMGKSALALQVALHNAKKFGKRSLMFSLEMSQQLVMQRIIATESRIEVTRLRTGQIAESEWPRLVDTQNRLNRWPVAIDGTSTLTPEQMRSRAIRHHARFGLDLIIVDYLQLMDVDRRGQNRHQEIAEISRSCKRLARELNIPIIVISQLSREVERRGNKRPMMSDLRESGAIEADADLILFIYRDEVYNEKTDNPGVAEIIIGKQRSGPSGTVDVFFRKNLTEFVDLAVNRTPFNQVN